MKNFPIIKNGKEYWISRSVSVVRFVFANVDNELCVLANKRGSGTPDYQGYWNCPCGYLDWDETLVQAVQREVKEECGIDINLLRMVGIDSDPKSNKQNVSVHYYAFYTGDLTLSIGEGGEENETEDMKWIPVDEVKNYQWAFNHGHLIKKYAKY